MGKPSPAMIIALAALFVALGGVGVAATGGNFILGQPNDADATTGLMSGVAGPAMRITSSSIVPNATALDLVVPGGKPPLTVSSTTKVLRLNADQLDGIDSNRFVQGAASQAGFQRTTGQTFFHRVRLTLGATARLLTVPGIGWIDVNCIDGAGTPLSRFEFKSTVNGLELGVESAHDAEGVTTWFALDNGQGVQSSLPDTWRIQLQGGTGGNGANEKLLTVNMFVHAGPNCVFQASALLQTMP